MKELIWDYYVDGFNVEQIECFDMALATASGYFNRNFYFYYCFLYAMEINWGKGTREESTQNILKRLGLRLQVFQPKDLEELIKIIKTGIDQNTPILAVLKYNSIYFDTYYKKNKEGEHTTIISGYGNNDIFILKDFLFAKRFIKTVFTRKVDVFIDIKIKIEQLAEMWQNSKNNGLNNILILEKEFSPEIEDDETLLEYFLRNVKIKDDNYRLYNVKGMIDYERIKRTVYYSIYMMLQILEYIIEKKEYNFSENQVCSFLEEKKQIEKNREILINVLIMDLMKTGAVSQDTISDFEKNDIQIFELISRVYSMILEMEPNSKMINLALNAIVRCDSERNGISSKYAVNGKMENDSDCWLSTFKWNEHWLIVDLNKQVNVNRFIIKHHPKKKSLITRDFRIEGSNDMKIWKILYKVNENVDSLNIININSVCYRYFRLYIEKANSINENAARIFSFEIYYI